MNEMITNQELVRLGKEITDRERTLVDLRSQIEERLRLAVPEVILQGQALLFAQSKLRPGQLLDWVRAYCPIVTPKAAAHYIHRAKKADEQMTLFKEFHILSDNDGVQKKQPAALPWPPDIEGIRRLSRALKYWETFSFDKCPPDSQDRVREILEPLAKKAWPEKF